MVFRRASRNPMGFVLELQRILWDGGKILVEGMAKAGMVHSVSG